MYHSCADSYTTLQLQHVWCFFLLYCCLLCAAKDSIAWRKKNETCGSTDLIRWHFKSICVPSAHFLHTYCLSFLGMYIVYIAELLMWMLVYFPDICSERQETRDQETKRPKKKKTKYFGIVVRIVAILDIPRPNGLRFKMHKIIYP